MTSYAKDWLASTMTLRDYFAAQALGAMDVAPWNFGAGDPIPQTANPRYQEYISNVAKTAYSFADAMLAEKERHEQAQAEIVAKSWKPGIIP